MFFNRWIQDNVLKSSLVHSLGVIWNDYNPSTDKAAVGMSCCSSLLVVFTETVSETTSLTECLQTQRHKTEEMFYLRGSKFWVWRSVTCEQAPDDTWCFFCHMRMKSAYKHATAVPSYSVTLKFTENGRRSLHLNLEIPFSDFACVTKLDHF